jgi:lipopolysaccharide/colanic/teichoic acid biosynthesis glycosyltransferase
MELGQASDHAGVPMVSGDDRQPNGRVALHTGMFTVYLAFKRALDVALAAGVLVVSAPVWVWAALRIKATDGGPVLYRANRVGLHGRTFRMLKFRTMVTDAELLGGTNTAADDPRLTRVGIFLRRWKLDEIPQFINVLRGEMSLVGPRPQVPDDVNRYSADERRLISVRPGITDWSSVLFRNEEELLAGHADVDRAYDKLIRPRKIALSLLYVERRSLRTDFRILLLTARAVLQPSMTEALIAREVPETS